MSIRTEKLSFKDLAFFRFKRTGKEFLLTNEAGEYCFLPGDDFQRLVRGRSVRLSATTLEQLREKDFIRKGCDTLRVSRRYANKYFVGMGTALHIVVVTLRCGQGCVYCHAGAGKGGPADHLDMSPETARAVVTRIFESPSHSLSIEFQGGEPLLNFKVVRQIIEQAEEVNRKAGRSLRFSLVTNLSLMNETILAYLFKHRVQICTSLDGPEKVHAKNRGGVSSYRRTVRWLARAQARYRRAKNMSLPSALVTVTSHSLAFPVEIVDEYRRRGLPGIHLRPIHPFGHSVGRWKQLSYSPEAYVAFYRRALEHIIRVNLGGERFVEMGARIYLQKILTDTDPLYLDLRSPCGAGIGQVAYAHDGDIYACDEGRMMARMGDTSFRLGSVRDFSFDRLGENRVVRALCNASCLDVQPGCADCVYKPYCGVCPVANHAMNKNILVNAQFTCRIKMGMLDFLFEKLRDEASRGVFLDWCGRPKEATV